MLEAGGVVGKNGIETFSNQTWLLETGWCSLVSLTSVIRIFSFSSGSSDISDNGATARFTEEERKTLVLVLYTGSRGIQHEYLKTTGMGTSENLTSVFLFILMSSTRKVSTRRTLYFEMWYCTRNLASLTNELYTTSLSVNWHWTGGEFFRILRWVVGCRQSAFG